MTADRVISLIIAAIGTVALFAAPIATIIVARMNRRKDAGPDDTPPIVRGQTIDFAAKTVELYEERIADQEAEIDRLRKDRPAAE